jgi:hypothetical protein
MYFKTAEFAEPSPWLYYLVTGKGNFLVKKTNLYSSVTEARVLPGLLEQESSLSLRFPKVPREIMEKMYGFFDAVYQQWEGEAVVFLYYAPESKEFRLAVPPQTLFRYRTLSGFWRTAQRVEYGYCPRPEGFLKLGDAHSHADLPAFFSCADDNDDKEDGLRITIGNLDRARPDVKVSFVVNRTRFILHPEDVIEEFSTPLPPPQEWLARVSCQEEHQRINRSIANQVREVRVNGQERHWRGKDD